MRRTGPLGVPTMSDSYAGIAVPAHGPWEDYQAQGPWNDYRSDPYAGIATEVTNGPRDLTHVYAALQKADAAGDTAGAQRLADYIRAQSAPQARRPNPYDQFDAN